MDWKVFKLNDVCDSISDGDHLAPPKSNSGVPFITISNIVGNSIDFGNTMFVPQEYYDRLDDRRKAKTDDILYTVVGSFGIPILIKDETQFAFQRHIAILRPKKNVVPSFLYYAMKSSDFFSQADAYAIGSAQRTISLTSLRRMKIALPALPIQQKIASILSAYDTLIENNTKRIRLLEQMAENLYKEWFVRFRFPGHENVEMVNGLPKGWKIEKLGNVANIFTGKCNREDAEENGLFPLFDRSQEIKKSNVWLKDCEAIIIPGEGTSFIPRYYRGKFNLHQRCYCVEPKNEKTGKYLFHMLMTNRSYFLSVATGATVPSLRQNNFTKMSFVLPTSGLIQKFDNIVNYFFKATDSLKEQNQYLSRQRDLLLPRLMSGRLEVTV